MDQPKTGEKIAFDENAFISPNMKNWDLSKSSKALGQIWTHAEEQIKTLEAPKFSGPLECLLPKRHAELLLPINADDSDLVELKEEYYFASEKRKEV